MKRILMCAMATLLPLATHAEESIWPGEYAGDCGNKVQCIIEIADDGGDKVDVKLVVANRVDFNDVKCKLEGRFSRSAVLGISGTFKGAPDVIIGRYREGVEVFGIPKKACGLSLNKKYVMFGD
ncbi:hypothetical protein GGE43_004769 [Agrobacterium tumefaciens]|uniref:Uncharacterized protein n=1 Tax=Agrobacterium radiobacter TaxID=362 RepID=A0ABR6J6M2_AGRRD|nr:hypothetical protein [Agrobacterium radiobacter]MBB4283885.1 hypothetical protein [Agrobacterium radiobacter]MBB4319619.1 hypothetical protein [Agrobacterium radiobacter]MBB4326006.1 hypothetical protein [Agrobacterium radiobacter]MBB4337849.1 hypothetical protein [Agrobacterium radiobacter]MBB4459461.1 hypothetical protein [Agrobacterium radiobacter]